jgi:hypothetical protein
MKQLGLAIQNYESGNRRIPFNRDPNAHGYGGHRLRLVVDRVFAAANRAGQHLRQGDRLERGVQQRVPVAAEIKMLQCPSDPQGGASRVPANVGLAMGVTNYKGVSGSNWNYGSFANGSDCFAAPSYGNGMFFRSDSVRRLTLLGITDGTSNTFAIGEDLADANLHLSWPHSNHATAPAVSRSTTRRARASRLQQPRRLAQRLLLPLAAHRRGQLRLRRRLGSFRLQLDQPQSYLDLSTIRGKEVPAEVP